ncbi:MAG: hypothetical protein IPK58_25140 [Acidobacteria bacterium]|nr:hypothetical protein [Acidobacteriota bacterium]
MAIWHIDEFGDNQYEHMEPKRHYECSLVQADGRFDLERDPRNIGDATDLFSREINGKFGEAYKTQQSLVGWTSSGLEIDKIGSVGSSISFTEGFDDPDVRRADRFQR